MLMLYITYMYMRFVDKAWLWSINQYTEEHVTQYNNINQNKYGKGKRKPPWLVLSVVVVTDSL